MERPIAFSRVEERLENVQGFRGCVLIDNFLLAAIEKFINYGFVGPQDVQTIEGALPGLVLRFSRPIKLGRIEMKWEKTTSETRPQTIGNSKPKLCRNNLNFFFSGQKNGKTSCNFKFRILGGFPLGGFYRSFVWRLFGGVPGGGVWVTPLKSIVLLLLVLWPFCSPPTPS